MQLKVIEGGRQPRDEPRPAAPGVDVNAWLEGAEPALRVAISTWLAGHTSTARDRMLADLAPIAAAGLCTEADVHAALSPSTPASLAIAACRLVRGTRPVAAAPRLRRLLGDASCARVRLHAAEALSHAGGPEARRALSEALVCDDDEEVRARAARGLGRLGDHRAVPALGGTVANVSEAPAVRGEAAEALGVIGRRSATALLVRALRDPEPEVRAGAAVALGMLGGLEVILALRPLEDDDAPTTELGSVSDCARAAIADIQRRSSQTG